MHDFDDYGGLQLIKFDSVTAGSQEIKFAILVEFLAVLAAILSL